MEELDQDSLHPSIECPDDKRIASLRVSNPGPWRDSIGSTDLHSKELSSQMLICLFRNYCIHAWLHQPMSRSRIHDRTISLRFLGRIYCWSHVYSWESRSSLIFFWKVWPFPYNFWNVVFTTYTYIFGSLANSIHLLGLNLTVIFVRARTVRVGH